MKTPALSALREDSILFESAWAHAPLTLPSHATVFTGLLPAQNGLHDNLGYVLNPAVPTLAELLGKAGYATGGAVTSVVLSGTTGIGRGFGLWDDDVVPTRAFQALSRVQRPGDEAEAAMERWIGKQSGPFLAFLHLYEPHAPYEPKEPFRSLYASPYDGEIATADAITGKFLDFLKAKGLYDGALIVLMSDHGEGLGDHGESEHGVFLYREVLQVPLLVKLPKGGPPAPRSVGVPVQLADVFTTIGRAAGLEGFAAPAGTVSVIDVADAADAKGSPGGASTPSRSSRGRTSGGASCARSWTAAGTTSRRPGPSSSTSRRTRPRSRTSRTDGPSRSGSCGSRWRRSGRRSRRPPPPTAKRRRSSRRSGTSARVRPRAAARWTIRRTTSRPSAS